MPPRSVTYLTTGLKLAGAETQLVELASGFRRRGWTVNVISMLPPEAFVDRLEKAGVGLHSLGMRPGVADPRAIYKLARILRRQRPDVVHSHMAKANFLARATRGLARTPRCAWVATAHNTIEGGRLVDLGYRISDHFSDVTTNVSRRAVDRYVRIKAVPASRIRLMYNGIRASMFDRDDESREAVRTEFGLNDRFTWLAIGRLEAAKDFPNLFRAVSLVAADHPNMTVLIAGRGILAEELKDIVDSQGLESHIRFIGERSDIPDIMNACDGYVMSSAWEGLPIVLLEAAAASLPVVATDVGGNNELVLDGESGFLVPPQDSNALAERMSYVMRLSDDQRGELGARGRRHVETTFDLELILDRWQELYEEFLEK